MGVGGSGWEHGLVQPINQYVWASWKIGYYYSLKAGQRIKADLHSYAWPGTGVE